MTRTLLGLILAGLCAGPSFADDRPKADSKAAVEAELKKFEGTWEFESLVVGGKAIPEAAIKESRLVLKGDRFTMTDVGVTYGGTFSFDLTKTPKTIDMTFTEGPEKGKTVHAIYELEGDTYRVCLEMGSEERPSRFESKPGTAVALEVLKRVKK